MRISDWSSDVCSSDLGANVARDVADAAFQLVFITHRRRARNVDDGRVPGLGIGHDRVRVRAAAGLDLADLDRTRRIADVEDAQAPEPLWARILGYTPKAAIDPAAGLLDRHDEDVAGDRHVPLSARADDRADQAGLVPPTAVEVEAVIIAEREQVAGKGHVGIGEIEKRSEAHTSE